MKISFVIPAYNEELYLEQCLKSVIRESKKASCETEIIVVNNASTDRTREIASSFPDVVLIDEPQKGLVKARQAGFLASTGDLIAHIDADTILLRGWIDRVLEEFASDSDLVALSGPFIYHDIPKTLSALVRMYYGVGFIVYLANRFVLRISSMLQGGNFVCRRFALERIGDCNPKFTFYGEDADLARRLHAVGGVKFTFRLPMYASGRRLVAEGPLTVAFRYSINYFWAVFFKKPFSKTSADFRF